MKIDFNTYTLQRNVYFSANISEWKAFEKTRDTIVEKADKRLTEIKCSMKEYNLEELKKNISMQNISLVQRICNDDKFEIGKVINIATGTNSKDARGLPLFERNNLVIKLLEKLYNEKGAKNSFNMTYCATYADEIGLNKIKEMLNGKSLFDGIIQKIKTLF